MRDPWQFGLMAIMCFVQGLAWIAEGSKPSDGFILLGFSILSASCCVEMEKSND